MQINESEQFGDYANYYNIFYKNKDYKSEVNYILNILKRNNITFGSILEYGSGTGSHAMHLSKNNFKITGVESSETMIKNAYKDKNIKYINGDIVDLNLNDKFDAVISMFHVMSYIIDNERFQSLMSNTYKLLKDNGTFIFDVWFTPSVMNKNPECRVTNYFVNKIKIIKESVPTLNHFKNTVTINYKITVDHQNLGRKIFNEEHIMRHFSVPEIENFAKLAGFRSLRAEELLTKKEPGLDTWAITFILQK